MIENATLLREAANQIDELDEQIRVLNEDKKAVYQNAKDTVGQVDYKAWREAVKLRQKRRIDREKLEQHDARVADILEMLEASGTRFATRVHDAREAISTIKTEHVTVSSSVAVTDGAGASQIAVHDAPAQTISHDPETGEITEQPLTEALLPSSSVEEGGGAFGFSSASDHLPDLPDFLRRAPKAQAVTA